MKIMIHTFLAVAFILELIAFVFFSRAGEIFLAGKSLAIISFVFLFFIVIAFWGTYMAPRAARKLPRFWHCTAKAFIYGVAAISLGNLEGLGFASCFIFVAAVNELLLRKHGIT